MAKAREKPGGSWSTRLQIYVVIMGGYYAYKTWKNGGLPDSSSGAASKGGAREECREASSHPVRRFKNMGSSWLSYFEAGSCSDTQLFMLHQASLSSETEYANTIPQLLAKAAPAGGLHVLAPDLPCHGYSACPAKENFEDTSALFARMLAGRPSNQQFAYMTSGRQAASVALAIVQRRKEAARMLLVRPRTIDPETKGLATASVAVDSARLAALTGAPPKADDVKPLSIGKMPRGCTVTLLYLDGDEEDDALKTELEDADVIVEVRTVDSLEEGMVPAVADMLAVDGASFATEEEV